MFDPPYVGQSCQCTPGASAHGIFIFLYVFWSTGIVERWGMNDGGAAGGGGDGDVDGKDGSKPGHDPESPVCSKCLYY